MVAPKKSKAMFEIIYAPIKLKKSKAIIEIKNNKTFEKFIIAVEGSPIYPKASKVFKFKLNEQQK